MTRPYDVAFDAAARLAEAGVGSPAVDARLLLADAMGLEVGRMLLADDVAPDELARFEAALGRREAGEPVQHITGVAHFRYKTLHVGPGVFIPRPETEVLVDLALRILGDRPAGQRRVVELCAGSGAISLALAHEMGGLEQTAVELSAEAWPWLQRNLDGVAIDLRHGDMAEACRDLDGTVDLVVVNPPYVPTGVREFLPRDVVGVDPDLALFSGPDGLDALRVVTDVATRLLRPGGWVVTEHDESHPEQAAALFAGPHFEAVTGHRDLTGRPRFVTARRAGVAGLAT